MVQRRSFLQMTLDADGLRTPDGTLALAWITRAEVVRNRVRGASPSEGSRAGTAGGVLLGGALAGPVGALGGGLLGSRLDSAPSPGSTVARTVSARIVFESPDLAYSAHVSVDQIQEAEEFVAAVKAAAGL